jgi:hypothetical protein
VTLLLLESDCVVVMLGFGGIWLSGRPVADPFIGSGLPSELSSSAVGVCPSTVGLSVLRTFLPPLPPSVALCCATVLALVTCFATGSSSVAGATVSFGGVGLSFGGALDRTTSEAGPLPSAITDGTACSPDWSTGVPTPGMTAPGLAPRRLLSPASATDSFGAWGKVISPSGPRNTSFIVGRSLECERGCDVFPSSIPSAAFDTFRVMSLLPSSKVPGLGSRNTGDADALLDVVLEVVVGCGVVFNLVGSGRSIKETP